MPLLDTNVLSEVVKPTPDRRVLAWLGAVDESATYLSVITIVELRFGVSRLPPSRRRQQLTRWLDATVERFEDRILPVDLQVANVVGEVLARSEAAGHPLRGNDALIAGTALAHDLVVATRNTAHFAHAGVRLVNPWLDEDV